MIAHFILLTPHSTFQLGYFRAAHRKSQLREIFLPSESERGYGRYRSSKRKFAGEHEDVNVGFGAEQKAEQRREMYRLAKVIISNHVSIPVSLAFSGRDSPS